MSYGMQGNKIPSGYKAGKMQNFTPEMMELFQGLMDQLGGGSYLSRLAGGDESLFDEMEGPAMKQFQQMQGDTASRFSGAGMGARRGSGFQNAMGQQTADFASDLYNKRSGMQMNAIKELQGMGNQLLGQKPYENFMTKKKPSFWESLMSAIGENLGSVPGAIVKSQGIGM